MKNLDIPEGGTTAAAPIQTCDCDGWRFQISVQNADDSIRLRSIKGTRPDGKTLTWTLPARLLQRPDLTSSIVEELMAELDEDDDTAST